MALARLASLKSQSQAVRLQLFSELYLLKYYIYDWDFGARQLLHQTLNLKLYSRCDAINIFVHINVTPRSSATGERQ